MSELRWFLLAAGLVLLGLVFWWTKREATGKPLLPTDALRRQLPRLGVLGGVQEAQEPGQQGEASVQRPDRREQPAAPERIVTVRITGQGSATFSGEALLQAMQEAGLRHGRFGIFHRHPPSGGETAVFSVASLVEPGTFDLARLKDERLPGVTLFLPLPAAVDNVAAFDDMLATARAMAAKLDGQLLDEQGSRLSVQRERFLREEVIQFQHRPGSS